MIVYDYSVPERVFLFTAAWAREWILEDGVQLAKDMGNILEHSILAIFLE